MRGFFEQFPYSNYHDLNADWLLAIVKQLEEDYKTIPDEIAKAVEEMEKRIDVKLNAVLAEYDKKINAIIADILQTAKDLEEFAKELEKRLDKELAEQQTWVTEQVRKLTFYVDGEVIGMHKRIAELDATLRAYTDARIQQVMDMIPELQNIHIISPLSGKLESLQKVINDVYDFLNQWALTTGEWDGLGLTVGAFDALDMTAFEIDNKPMAIIEEKERKCFNMFSPFDGNLLDAREVILQIVEYLQMGTTWSASEIDAIDFTAEQFDNAELTAYQLDWTKWTVA